MSVGTDFLRQVFLRDTDGNAAKIISVRGAEDGLKHLEVITQSPYERQQGIATQHRISSEEVTEWTQCPKCEV
jgi:hypothetical protein